MKKIFIAGLAALLTLSGCKYDDGYLKPELDETVAYFASAASYNRTVIVGEGLQFKIGAAMAGTTENKKNETVGMTIPKDPLTGGKELLPAAYYNSSELNGVIQATIPAGQFLGYFTVKLDSVKFLSDPVSLSGKYTLPVKIVETSLGSINEALSTVLVSLKYMSNVDGYYLYESTIKEEVNGTIVDSKTVTEKNPNESDNSAWRLATQAPFKVLVTPAVNSFSDKLKFNLTVQGGTITYESVAGQPVVEADGANSYDPKTRDFQLKFKYNGSKAGTVYHVTTKLIFRNRMVDNINQTREYLSYFN